MSDLSRRALGRRLAATRVDVPLDDRWADDLATRLSSLAVAASFESGAKKGRLRRKFLAAIGSIGVIGWIGVTGAAASVGLATTGNLPAPIQDVVSDVFDVVGIEIPKSNDEPSPVDEPSEPSIAPEPEDTEKQPNDLEPNDTVETTVPTTVPTDEVISPEDETEIENPEVVVPISPTRPGNSGSTPAVTAPGQVKKDDDKKNDDSSDDDERPSNTAPGQVKKDDDKKDDGDSSDGDERPSNTAPGQVKKDEDKKDDEDSSDDSSDDDERPSNTAPGQVKKNVDDDDSRSDDESSSPGKSGDAPGRNKKDDD